MKTINRIILFFLIISYSSLTYSQDTTSYESLKKILIKKETLIDSLTDQIDSLSNKMQFNHSGSIVIDTNNDKRTWNFLLPSILAIGVSLIALFGTIYVGRMQKKSSEKLLNKQLENAKSTIKDQLKVSKETAELNFRQNVLSNNRQKWIDDLRVCVSSLSSQILVCCYAQTKMEKMGELLDLITKVELMLNPKDDRDNELVSILHEIQSDVSESKDKIDFKELGSKRYKAIAITKKILKDEWERVKRGE